MLHTVMLACMIFIVGARLFIRARDRRIAEAENDMLMKDNLPQGEIGLGDNKGGRIV